MAEIPTASITLTAESAERLKKFAHLCGFEDPADVMNHAVDIMTWAVMETHEGRTVCSFDQASGSLRPMTSPLLRAVKDLPFPLRQGARPHLTVSADNTPGD